MNHFFMDAVKCDSPDQGPVIVVFEVKETGGAASDFKFDHVATNSAVPVIS
jgi:hypothetical protein